MASLRVLVCLMGLFVSQCIAKESAIRDVKKPPTGCVDEDGTEHALDSAWERDCMECECSKTGLSCSSKLPDPNTVDIPEDCELVVNEQTCSAKMVLKSDKSKECTPT